MTSISLSKQKRPAFLPRKEGRKEGRKEATTKIDVGIWQAPRPTKKTILKSASVPSYKKNDFVIGKRSAFQKSRFGNWQALRPTKKSILKSASVPPYNKSILKLASVPPYDKVDFETGKRSALQKSRF